MLTGILQNVLRPVIALFVLTGFLIAADPRLVNLLPPSTKIAAGINVGQAKDSPFGQFLLAQIAAQDHLTHKSGFDPRTDLNEVLIGTAGNKLGQFLVLATGTFNAKAIFAAAQAAGGTFETYHDVLIFTPKEKPARGLAFFRSSIAVAGDLPSVLAAINRRAEISPAVDAVLLTQIEEESAKFDAWSISTVPLSSLANEKLPDQQLNTLLNSDLFKSIQQSSGGVKFGQNIDLSAQAVTDSNEHAVALAEVFRFLVTMAQAQAPANLAPIIASLLQTLNIQTDGNTVTLSASIPEKEIETLVLNAHQK